MSMGASRGGSGQGRTATCKANLPTRVSIKPWAQALQTPPTFGPIMDDIWGQGRMSSVYTRFWGFCSIYCPYTIRFMGRVLEVVARLHLQ